MRAILFVIHIIILSGISYQLLKGREKYAWVALVFRFFCGVAIGLLYTTYYDNGDTVRYFQDGARLANFALHHFSDYLQFLWYSDGNLQDLPSLNLQEPRAIFLIKIVSVFNLATTDNYWIIACYFSLISFLGAFYLVNRLTEYLPQTKPAAIVAFLFFPSLTFWSSGIIKESLAMGCLYFLSGIVLDIWFSKKVTIYHVVLTIFAAWILWSLKYYFATVFFSIALTTIALKLVMSASKKTLSTSLQLILWFSILLVPAVIASQTIPNFRPGRFLSVITENYDAFNRLSANEDVIHYSHLEPTLSSVVSNTPLALISGLFRPFIWEAGNPLQILTGIENMLLLLLTMWCFVKINWMQIFQSRNRILFIGTLLYIFSLCVFIALSTPNFGTLSRYRVGYLPYFILLILSEPRLSSFTQRSLDRLGLDKS